MLTFLDTLFPPSLARITAGFDRTVRRLDNFARHANVAAAETEEQAERLVITATTLRGEAERARIIAGRLAGLTS